MTTRKKKVEASPKKAEKNASLTASNKAPTPSVTSASKVDEKTRTDKILALVADIRTQTSEAAQTVSTQSNRLMLIEDFIRIYAAESKPSKQEDLSYVY